MDGQDAAAQTRPEEPFASLRVFVVCNLFVHGFSMKCAAGTVVLRWAAVARTPVVVSAQAMAQSRTNQITLTQCWVPSAGRTNAKHDSQEMFMAKATIGMR